MHTCQYCGLPTDIDPADQTPPVDYCGEHTVTPRCVRCGEELTELGTFCPYSDDPHCGQCCGSGEA